MEERTAGIERFLREREEKETADIEAMITELSEAIEKELAEPGYRQLELFTDNQSSQLIRNTEELQARLEQILQRSKLNKRLSETVSPTKARDSFQ